MTNDLCAKRGKFAIIYTRGPFVVRSVNVRIRRRHPMTRKPYLLTLITVLTLLFNVGLSPAQAVTGRISTTETQSFQTTLLRNISGGWVGRGIAVTPHGQRIYAASSQTTIADINANSFEEIASIPICRDPAGIAIKPDGAYVYVVSGCGGFPGAVAVIRTSDNTVVRTMRDVAAVPWAIAISPDGQFAYVTNDANGFNDVAVIRTSDQSVIGRFKGVGNRSRGIAVGPGGRYVYVTSFASGTISIIDTTIGQVVNTIQVGGSSLGGVTVTPDGQYAYVANGNQLIVLSTSDNNISTTIPVPGGASAISFTPDGQYAYIGAGLLYVLRTSDSTIVQTLDTTGAGSWNDFAALVVSPTKNQIYVTNSIDQIISIFTYGETFSITGQVTDASTNQGLAGVTISAGMAGSTITDQNGNYSFTGLAVGSYNLTPTKSRYGFSPSSAVVTGPPNAVQNFIATPLVIDYFGLGDSIASGHGLMDTGGPCRRSLRSYPHKVAELLSQRYATVNWTILACSGATAGQPSRRTLADDPNKWLQNQVDYVLAHLSNRPTLVSITIGANDFNWSDIGGEFQSHLQEDFNQFQQWADGKTATVKSNVLTQVQRLLAHENIVIVLTDMHNPINTNSFFFLPTLYKKPLSCVSDGCYNRTEYVAHKLSGAFLEIWSELGQPSRLQIAAVHEKFHLDGGHESPTTGSANRTCGYSSPIIANTWIQYQDDPLSNSNPDLPANVKKYTGGPWKGDCFHPNDAGAAAYADAVNEDAIRAGR